MRMIRVMFSLLVFLDIPVYAQADYLRLEKMISCWIEENEDGIQTNKRNATKTYYNKSFDYQIVGALKNGILQPATYVEIIDKNNSISGIVKLLDGSTFVSGKKISSGCCTYGTFKISNTVIGTFSSKKSLAGDLCVEDVEVLYHKGFYNDCPTILSMAGTPFVAVDGIEGGRGYNGFSANVDIKDLRRIGYTDITALLLTVNENATMEWDGGHIFRGNVQPVLNEDGYIHFRLKEGIQENIPNGPLSISVQRIGEDLQIKTIYDPSRSDSGAIKEEIITARASSIPENTYWNKALYCNDDSEIRCIYTNGDQYTGKCEFSIKEQSKNMQEITMRLTNGTYKWANGDSFTGNLSRETFFGFFIDGETKFSDGIVVKGNWLKQYNLTGAQYQSLLAFRYPTQIREEAKRLVFSNKYTIYEGYDRIYYFDPKSEHADACYMNHLIYDKERHKYICCNTKNIADGKIYLEFQVDKQGRHTTELVYEASKPAYINVIDWHSNGELKSIRSYHYDTREIYLSLNFFSDGSLKNAYKYGIGNSGENILRMSKESHPTLDSFTTLLYDLDGNYERTVDWDIGKDDFLWGRTRMEPSRLNIEGLQPVDVSQTDETLSGNMDDNQDANKEMEPRVSMQGTFNLDGRSIAGDGLPVPAIIVQDEGTVVVNITVNPAGKVVATSINQRTNTVNPELRKTAEEAAKKTCFNKIYDIDNQTGTITYHFKLR